MGMDHHTKELIEHLQQVINKILFLKKKRLFQFQDIMFYPSEIHVMLLINEQSATNATKMAEQLGVTKGAVSQTLSRLERKSVLTKTKDPYRKNELTLTFTPFGKKAFEHYSKHTGRLFKKHQRYLKTFSTAEKKVIQRFLVEVENVFDQVD